MNTISNYRPAGRTASLITRGMAAVLGYLLVPAPAAAQDIQRIAAIINEDIVSEYDVDMRLNLVLSSTGSTTDPEERRRVRPQILEGLVDEQLQIQEAEELEITITDDEIEEGITRLAVMNNLTRGQFEDFLLSVRSGIATIRTRVHAELMWNELVGGRLASQLAISDAEIQGVLDRMQADTGKPEYNIAEIYLIVETPDQEAETKLRADRLVSQLANGAQFDVLARQFSDGATAAIGGDVGWVPAGESAPEVDEALSQMIPGRITLPVRTAGGYYILLLRDRRKILTVNPMEVELDLKQITLAISADALPEEIDALRETIEARTRAIESCSSVEEIGTELGATSAGPLGKMKLGELPTGTQNLVETLAIGAASRALVGTNSMRVFIVCGRAQPDVEMPSFDEIENRLTRQRLALMARRYLRDLRRDAIVDYK